MTIDAISLNFFAVELMGKYYNFDDRPGKIFSGLQHCRSTILIVLKGTGVVLGGACKVVGGIVDLAIYTAAGIIGAKGISKLYKCGDFLLCKQIQGTIYSTNSWPATSNYGNAKYEVDF